MGRTEPVQGFEILGALLIAFLAFGTAVVLYWILALGLRRRRGRQEYARPLAVGRVVLLAAGLLTAGSLVSQWLTYRAASRGRVTCMNHIKHLASALSVYISDYDAFPPDGKWCDALAAGWVDLEKDPDAFVCPARPDLRCGYAMNSAYLGLRPTQLAEKSWTPFLFESDAGWNAHGGPELVTRAPRHLGETWVAFGAQNALVGSVRPEQLKGTTDWISWIPAVRSGGDRHP